MRRSNGGASEKLEAANIFWEVAPPLSPTKNLLRFHITTTNLISLFVCYDNGICGITKNWCDAGSKYGGAGNNGLT